MILLDEVITIKSVFVNGNVQARCPDCGGAITTFEFKDSSKEHGSVIIERSHSFNGFDFSRIIYKLLRCAGCGRGGLAKLHANNQYTNSELESFFPVSIEHVKIPENVPIGIKAEFFEAEICASFGAWRAASALLRSTLEKLLRANGYIKGPLASRINEAADDGVITSSRRQRAHDDVRVLGNDVLHDEWREVTEDEVVSAHHYVQRILEDFYDDRHTVESVLSSKGRITK